MTPWFNLPDASACGWQAPGDVAIIGAGLAGLCTARALLSVGFKVTVYEAGESIAAGASASPAGIVKPYVTRQSSDAMRFYEQAYDTLFEWLNELPDGGCFNNIGALQLEERPYPDGHARYDNLNAQAASAKAGVSLQHDGLFFKQAGWLSVEQFCQCLLMDVEQRGGKVVLGHALTALKRHDSEGSRSQNATCDRDSSSSSDRDNHCGTWELTFNDAPSLHCKQVVLASGTSLINHEWLPEPELIPARGQITAFERDYALNTVISGRHYAIPDKQCVWVGATFDRGNADESLNDDDDEQNRRYAGSMFAERAMNAASVTPRVVNRFAGVRCTTLDRFPIVGPVPILSEAQEVYHDIHHGRGLADYPSPSFHSGLAVMGGFGSRGIAAAPYSSVLLANWASGSGDGDADRAGKTSGLYAENRLLSPLRFLIRRLKRGH